jgi:hypothetical protein
MANELTYTDEGLTGSTLYVVVWNASSQAWDGDSFATYTTTRGDFDIAATEISGTGLWQATMPGSAGGRRWAWYLQAGGSPSHANDIQVGIGDGYWDGSNIGSTATVGEEQIEEIVDGVVAGVGSGGGSGGPFLNDPPGRAFTSKLGTRADGTAKVDRPCRVEAGESVVWAVDCSLVLRPGRNLDSMTEPLMSGNAELTVGTTAGTNYGINDQIIILLVTASAEAEGEGTITFSITFGETSLNVTVPVKVIPAA